MAAENPRYNRTVELEMMTEKKDQKSIICASLYFASMASLILLCTTCPASIPVAAYPPKNSSDAELAHGSTADKTTDEQIQYYERCLTLFPSNDVYHVALGFAHYIKASELRDEKTDQDIAPRTDVHFRLASKEFQVALAINSSNAEAYAYQGMVYAEQKQYSNAVEYINRATQAGSTNSTVWYCRGVVLEKVWQPQDSIDAYATAIRLSPDNVQPYLSLARLYNNIKRYSEALCVCSNAMARFPTHPDVFGFMARSLLKAGHADETVAMCQKWLKNDPDNIQIRYRLGQGLAGMHQYDAAIKEQTRILATNPRDCDAYNEIGLCLWAKGNHNAAIHEFRSGLGVHTNCPVLLLNLGQCLENTNAHEEAIEVLEKSRAINPNSFEVCIPLANAYQHTGQHEKAKQTCFQHMALMPWIADPYFGLASIYFESGDYNQSIKYGREGLDRDPAAASEWYNVGLALQRQHKLNEAIDALANAVKIDSSILNPHLAYVDTLRLSGKFSEATDACRTAAARFPTNSEPLVLMGMVWESQRQWTNAVNAYQQAAILDTNCVDAIIAIARVMEAENRLPEAAEAFSQALLKAPTNSTCRSSLISALFRMGDKSKASQVLNEGMAIKPNDVILMGAQAEMFAAERNVTEAVAVLAHAVQLYPHDSPSRFNLAHYYEALGQRAVAMSNWLFIATNDPSFPIVHQRLALTYARTGRLREALAEFKQYANLAPADVNAHNDLGYTYYQLGMNDEAIHEYEIGITCDPKLGIIHYNMALAYYAKGRFRDAIESCATAKAAGYLGNPRFIQLLRTASEQPSGSVIAPKW